MIAETAVHHRLRNDPAFSELKRFVIEATGLHYYAERDDELSSRIADRLDALSVPDAVEYLALLRNEHTGEAELDRLIQQLTIGETYFFRHPQVFDALRDVVIPALIESNRAHRRLRIWSAACSIGAEPYSVSILLDRHFRAALRDWDVTIIGTDINRQFLQRARQGVYEQWTLRNLCPSIRDEAFRREGEQWCIEPRHQARVSFQYHNLVRHPLPSPMNNLVAFDLILCRNVMIYFSEPVIRKTLDRFRQCLVDGGWLIVGHAEPEVERFRQFCTVHAPGAVLYRRADAACGPADGAAGAWLAGATTPGPTALPLPAARIEPLPHTTRMKPAGPVASAPPPANDRTESFAHDMEQVIRLADRGDIAGALMRCRALVERDRLHAAPQYHYAMLLEAAGRHDEAERGLRRAIYLDRTYVAAHYYLGVTAMRRKDSDQAARSFRNTVALLDQRPDKQSVAGADGMSVRDLRDLTQRHLELLEVA